MKTLKRIVVSFTVGIMFTATCWWCIATGNGEEVDVVWSQIKKLDR